MRAFEPFNRKYKWNHPEDMKTIIEYLESTGKINIDYAILEDLYYEYSDSVCCGWRVVDEDSLPQFAKYLANVELIKYGSYRYLGDYDEYDEEDED